MLVKKLGDKAHSLLKPSPRYADYGSGDHICLKVKLVSQTKTTAVIWRTQTIVTVMWTTEDLVNKFSTLLLHFFRTSLLAARQQLMLVPHGDA